VAKALNVGDEVASDVRRVAEEFFEGESAGIEERLLAFIGGNS